MNPHIHITISVFLIALILIGVIAEVFNVLAAGQILAVALGLSIFAVKAWVPTIKKPPKKPR